MSTTVDGLNHPAAASLAGTNPAGSLDWLPSGHHAEMDTGTQPQTSTAAAPDHAFDSQPTQHTFPARGGEPQLGPAAYDYYSAQSDYIQAIMRAREARAPKPVPHITIKGQGQSQSMRQLPGQGLGSYPAGARMLLRSCCLPERPSVKQSCVAPFCLTTSQQAACTFKNLPLHTNFGMLPG